MGPALSPRGMLRVGAAAIILLATVAATTPPASTAAGSPPPSSPWYHLDERGDVQVDLYYGWLSTCPHCAKARPVVAELEAELPWLTVHSLQLDGDSEANRQLIVDLAASIGEEIQSVPAFLFAGRLRTGFDEATTTGVSLRAELVAYHDELVAALPRPSTSATPAASATPTPSPTPAGAGTSVVLPLAGPVDARTISLPVLAIVLGGLDAFNPCALSVLLFLIWQAAYAELYFCERLWPDFDPDAFDEALAEYARRPPPLRRGGAGRAPPRAPPRAAPSP